MMVKPTTSPNRQTIDHRIEVVECSVGRVSAITFSR